MQRFHYRHAWQSPNCTVQYKKRNGGDDGGISTGVTVNETTLRIAECLTLSREPYTRDFAFLNGECLGAMTEDANLEWANLEWNDDCSDFNGEY